MSGFLEQLKAQADASTAAIAQIVAAVQALQAAPAAVAPAAAPAGLSIGLPAAAPVATLGGFGAPAAVAPANVTDAMIMTLIEPHLASEAFKTAAQGELTAMGIDALQNTRPDQYPELYQRFQALIARMGGGAAAAPAASII